MKRILRISGIILLNLGMILLAVLLYFWFTLPIIKATDAPNGIEQGIIILVAYVGLMLVVMNSRFRRFGIGFGACLITGILFLLFYLNRSMGSEGDYKSLKLYEARWVDNKCYLDVAFNRRTSYSLEVSMEKCLKVDSVQVRIDKGFFGMGTLTDDVRIVENSNCQTGFIDSSELLKSHMDLAHKLAQKRCFPDAIKHYSACIVLDSMGPDAYYHRGQILMAREQYDKALTDFITSALLRYVQLDPKALDFLENGNPAAYTRELLTKLENKNYEGLSVYLEELNAWDDFDTHQKLIAFCLERFE